MDEKKRPKNDLFNNPMVDAALKAMTPEQVEEYQKIGEYMYSTTDFTDPNPQPKSVEDDMANGVFYVREGLKAGLHPQDMSQKEIRLMHEIYGPDWYKEFGYDAEEIPKIDATPETQQVHPKIPMTKKQLRNLEKKLKKKEWKKNNPGQRCKK